MINFSTLFEYINRGERGPRTSNFIFFILFNCLFIYLVTILWNSFLGKDLGDYRLYFSSTFSSWVALTSAVHFGGWNHVGFYNNTKYIFFASISIFIIQFTISIYLLCYPLGLITMYESIFIIFNQTLYFLILLPLAIFLSILRSINALLKSTIRIIWRLLFFLTPIIWMPTQQIIELRGEWVIFNPFTLISLPALIFNSNNEVLVFPNDFYASLILFIIACTVIISLIIIIKDRNFTTLLASKIPLVSTDDNFEKNFFPTYFTHSSNPEKHTIQKRVPINGKIKLLFLTDVSQNYLKRNHDAGNLAVFYRNNIESPWKPVSDCNYFIKNGSLYFRCKWPIKISENEKINLKFILFDSKNKLNLRVKIIGDEPVEENLLTF
tara:strand:- start:2235 stop:3377 length:1143 start_codon:yes stop_codon:yes gene_type:complete